jgi:hypothetical protein
VTIVKGAASAGNSPHRHPSSRTRLAQPGVGTAHLRGLPTPSIQRRRALTDHGPRPNRGAGPLSWGAAAVSGSRDRRATPVPGTENPLAAYRPAGGLCRPNTAPNGSTTTPMRPNGVSSGAMSTVPPPSPTSATAASTSATVK